MTADPASSSRYARLGGYPLPSPGAAMSDRDHILRKIESLFLTRQPLSYADWREDYAGDPELAPFVGRLIWSFEVDGAPCSGLLRDAGLHGLQDRDIDAPSCEAGVALWHPVTVSAEEVLAWRHRLQALGVSQPFRQAHRESYALTEADHHTGSYSKRFAAHILDQQRFATLCRDRGWSYDLQGMAGGFNVPTLALEAWGLAAEFWIEPLPRDGSTAPAGLPHLTTDQVCFRDLDGERLPLASVPEVVFSEVLRDVDLFVTGASVCNDTA